MIEGQRILVTGGTGFVGRHLVRRLCAHGGHVAVVVRAGSDRSVLPAAVHCVQEELDACGPPGPELIAAVSQAELVVHCAARLFARSWKDYFQDNVIMSMRLGQIVAEHGALVRRVLMLSSLAASGPCAEHPGRGDADFPAPVSAYGWSKLSAELAMEKFLGSIPLTIIRPPIIYGPGDKGLLPFFRLAVHGLVNYPGVRPAPLSFVHVTDLVQAVLLCMKASVSGIFHVDDGEPSSLRAFGAHIARAAGRRPHFLPTPHWLIQGIAHAAVLACWIGGGVFPLNPDKALEGRQCGWLADGSRLRDTLGFVPGVGQEQGVRETVAWYRQAHWL